MLPGGPPTHSSSASRAGHGAATGNDERGIEVGQRLQGEATLVQARVRNREARPLEGLIPVEQEIEIDRARAPARAHPSFATQVALDREQPVEQVRRGELRVDRNRAVQEARLVDEPDRIGLAKTGDGHDLDLRIRLEQVDRCA